MNTEDYRKEIDVIDDKLIELFKQRMDVAAKIADYKKNNNLPILDAQREREKIAAVMEKAPEDYRDYASLLYSLIFELSRSYQNRLNGPKNELPSRIKDAIEKTPALFPEYASVACQGAEGSNSQIACDKLFRNANIMYLSNFDAVFSSIEKGLCRYGVIPVENSNAGTVNSVYDLMMHHHFNIVRSIRIKIDHNLLANPGAKISDIKEIYSHEQAISQCSDYLASLKNVRIIPCENTAIAAKMVALSGRKDIAALASRNAMKYYELECLKESVQNTDNNYTRFVCISK